MLRSADPTRPRTLEELLPPDLAARIAQLDVSSRKIFAGKIKGERRSKKRGESVEFADHRPYTTGDDLRHIDWNLFGRLDRLFLKLFLEEEDLSLHLVIDCSASQDTGDPSKFLFAQRLATALAYIGLVNLNRVAITTIAGSRTPDPSSSSSSSSDTLRDLRGRRRLADVARFITSIQPAGPALFTDAAKRLALARRGKGVMILISDCFFKEGYDDGLRLLVGRGYDLFVVQVLSPQEINPTLTGDLRLKDIEDADTAEITISAPLLKRYKANLNAYVQRLRDFCAQRDIAHIMTPSDTPVDVLVLDYLRSRGLLS